MTLEQDKGLSPEGQRRHEEDIIWESDPPEVKAAKLLRQQEREEKSDGE